MSPITHLLVGWVALERWLPERRDKALVCFAGVLPDLDGLGIVLDVYTRITGLPETDFYQSFHRLWGHGLPAALLLALLAATLAHARWRVFLPAFIAVHLHFGCDLLGSRGTTPQDLWPIHYLMPLSNGMLWSWSGQWPLVGWQNLTLSMALVAWTMMRAASVGYSIVLLFNRRADLLFVDVLRQWRHRIAGS